VLVNKGKAPTALPGADYVGANLRDHGGGIDSSVTEAEAAMMNTLCSLTTSKIPDRKSRQNLGSHAGITRGYEPGNECFN